MTSTLTNILPRKPTSQRYNPRVIQHQLSRQRRKASRDSANPPGDDGHRVRKLAPATCVWLREGIPARMRQDLSRRGSVSQQASKRANASRRLDSREMRSPLRAGRTNSGCQRGRERKSRHAACPREEGAGRRGSRGRLVRGNILEARRMWGGQDTGGGSGLLK